MNKIVYLLGAGASANALPIVSNFPDRIETLSNYLSGRVSEIGDEETVEKVTSSLSRKNHLLNIISGLRALSEQSRKSASIDTLAKKLYLKGNVEKLDSLKLLLSVFLHLEQILNLPDYRYDAFLASILSGEFRKFPPNLRILSWNYDMQFEFAYSEYTESYEISTNQNMMNIVHKNAHETVNPNNFGIFKINGTASLYQASFRNQIFLSNQIGNRLNSDILREVVDAYATCITRNDVRPLLSFAWESESAHTNALEMAKIAASNPDVLVIIGYSFPLFNRAIDKMLCDQMPGLRKVYIQAPESNANGIKERFLSLRPNPHAIEVVIRTDTSQFLIPYEF